MDRRKCSKCGLPGHNKQTCSRKSRTGGKAFDPWRDLEWEEHDEARTIVADNPDGLTLEEVGKYLGVTRERVRQIEHQALQKLENQRGLAETVTLDGVTCAVQICERCDQWFPRQGRAKICKECVEPKPRPKPKARAPRRSTRRTSLPTPPPRAAVATVSLKKPPVPDPPVAVAAEPVEVVVMPNPEDIQISFTFDLSDLW